MEILCFIKYSVVARFKDSGGCVEIYDVLIRRSITKEESREVMAVKFAMP